MIKNVLFLCSLSSFLPSPLEAAACARQHPLDGTARLLRAVASPQPPRPIRHRRVPRAPSPLPSQRRDSDGQTQLDRCARHVLPTAPTPAPAVDEAGGQSAHQLLSFKLQNKAQIAQWHSTLRWHLERDVPNEPRPWDKGLGAAMMSCWEPRPPAGSRGGSAPLKSRCRHLVASLESGYYLSFWRLS